jgi:hypothetical protein
VRPLITLSVRCAALAALVVFAAGLGGGVVRLLPWLVAKDVPLPLAVPFARLLVAAALEAAVLVGVPIGAGLGAALFVDRGEARALAALGARPSRLVAGLIAPGVLAVAAFVALSSSADGEQPGRFAARLLAAGRAACAGSSEPRRVDVPVLSVAWLCFPAGPRIAGRSPGTAAPVWFSAAGLRPSDDLRSLELDEVSLSAQLAGREVRIRAAEVHLHGLPSWGPSRLLAGALRGFVVASSAVAAALVAAFLAIRRPAVFPVVAAVASAMAAVALLAAVRALDAHGAPPALYTSVPLVGVAAQVAAFSLADWVIGSFAR